MGNGCSPGDVFGSGLLCRLFFPRDVLNEIGD